MSELSPLDESKVEHRFVTNGDVKVHVAELGPKDGTPVVLLHGFPEFWWSWRHQMQPLADAGFRVIAPDLRGYGDSSKPRGIASYRIPLLLEDIAAVVRSSGRERAHIVAHDWGGTLAWHFAGRKPELVDKLVVMNGPHPDLYAKLMFTRAQFPKSWYVLLYQLPFLPEWRASKAETLTRALRGWSSKKERFDDRTMARFIEAFQKPGVATSAINYYRAAARFPAGRTPKIDAKTLVLWGENDRALDITNLDGLDRKVSDLRVVRIPGASHWVQTDAAEKVNEELLSFLAK